MDRRGWQAATHTVAKSQTQLNQLSRHTLFHFTDEVAEAQSHLSSLLQSVDQIWRVPTFSPTALSCHCHKLAERENISAGDQ